LLVRRDRKGAYTNPTSLNSSTPPTSQKKCWRKSTSNKNYTSFSREKGTGRRPEKRRIPGVNSKGGNVNREKSDWKPGGENIFPNREEERKAEDLGSRPFPEE